LDFRGKDAEHAAKSGVGWRKRAHTQLMKHYAQRRSFEASYGGVALLEILELLEQLHAGTPNFLSTNFVHLFVEAGQNRAGRSPRFDWRSRCGTDLCGTAPRTMRVTAQNGPDAFYVQLAPDSKGPRKVAMIYSITSSARARSVGGTVRPSALAVFRLMFN
jgi:hypothetical protein